MAEVIPWRTVTDIGRHLTYGSMRKSKRGVVRERKRERERGGGGRGKEGGGGGREEKGEKGWRG